MVKYEICRRDGPSVKAHVSFKRGGPHVKTALRDLVYQMLAANALLDRPAAQRLKAEVDACDTSKPPRGYYRSQRFTIATTPNSPYLDEVELYIS